MNNEEKILGLLTEMKTDMAEMKTDMAEMKAGMAEMKTRMDRLEENQAQQGELLARVDERSHRTALIVENEIAHKLALLYEGHETIMETLGTLASKNRVEELERDVALLKDVLKLMRREIDEMKKAQ